MPTEEELLAYKKDNAEMCQYIKAKSLKFLSLQGLYKALTGNERNDNYPNVITILLQITREPSDNIKGLKIKQLSFQVLNQITNLNNRFIII